MNTEYKITYEEHKFTSDLKLKFCGYGEWVEEPDEIDLEYKGFQANITRVFVREPYAEQEAYFGGHLCGYVRIPEDHVLFEEKELDLDCHGGITYNELNDGHWIGFDCVHSGDYGPTMEYMRNTDPALIKIKEMFPIPEGMKNHPWFKPVYRNVAFCINECINLIDQLLDAKYCKEEKVEK